MNNITIGLFGTCGNSTWRNSFIEEYNKLSINYFNPQLPAGTWTPEFADEENRQLKTNEIVLFPITDETTAHGSLSEIGFSISDTLRNLKERYLIVFIDPECNDNDATENERKTSVRDRKLTLSKCELEQTINSKVFVVNSLEEMLSLSIKLSKVF